MAASSTSKLQCTRCMQKPWPSMFPVLQGSSLLIFLLQLCYFCTLRFVLHSCLKATREHQQRTQQSTRNAPEIRKAWQVQGFVWMVIGNYSKTHWRITTIPPHFKTHPDFMALATGSSEKAFSDSHCHYQEVCDRSNGRGQNNTGWTDLDFIARACLFGLENWH